MAGVRNEDRREGRIHPLRSHNHPNHHHQRQLKEKDHDHVDENGYEDVPAADDVNDSFVDVDSCDSLSNMFLAPPVVVGASVGSCPYVATMYDHSCCEVDMHRVDDLASSQVDPIESSVRRNQ